ncbi:MAG: hypothetical protein HC802_11110 [Caldilineaceae bacterium]|nr:hypothetical protein [Caldilineaceae bacterium]
MTTLPSHVEAHGGGTPQLTDVPVGGYRLFLWTQPEPWRAGEVHVSMIVTLPAETTAGSNDNAMANRQLATAVSDVAVKVHFAPIDNPTEAITVIAEPQDLLNNVSFEADVELPAAGRWEMTVTLEGPEGSGSAQFGADVLASRSISWPAAGLVLLVLVALLAGVGFWSRRRKAPMSTQRTRRPNRVLKDSDGNIQEAI